MELEQVARDAVNNKGKEYQMYHAEFIAKPLWKKLLILLMALPRHLYYSYSAPDLYKSLRYFLFRRQ